MKTYTESIISEKDLSVFNNIKQLVDSVNEFKFTDNHILTCHEICHAVADIVPGVRIETGYYLPGLEHSWLMTTSYGEPSGFDNIIDVYPFGMIGGPILIENSVAMCLKNHGLYKPTELPNLNILSKNFKDVVDIVKKTLSRNIRFVR